MKMLLGVDEAGRGPLAGPVAVGVVAVREDYDFSIFPGLNDSKKLTEKARERLFELLLTEAEKGTVGYHVELVSHADIDANGIVPSVRHGVTTGVQKLLPNASDGRVFLDGSLHAPKEYEQETIIRGDATVPAIMLASVAAKVTRDRLMLKYAEQYPSYGFEKHKGYGTSAHYAALDEYGPCALHRLTFLHA